MTLTGDTNTPALTMADKRLREIRIEWRILGRNGGGHWCANIRMRRAILEKWCAAGCKEHGAGTHWIAERDA